MDLCHGPVMTCALDLSRPIDSIVVFSSENFRTYMVEHLSPWSVQIRFSQGTRLRFAVPGKEGGEFRMTGATPTLPAPCQHLAQ